MRLRQISALISMVGHGILLSHYLSHGLLLAMGCLLVALPDVWALVRRLIQRE